jgi:hypothetical protein
MTEERIKSETLESLVEEITKEVVKRIAIRGDLGIDLSLGYYCTGAGYTCGGRIHGRYSCKGMQIHGCTGIFTCVDIFIHDYD